MERNKTVLDTKAAFLRAQVRLLTAALQPSAQWRDFCPPTDDGDLSNKAISVAMVKVNEHIKSHSRAVYSVQSQRHVAEQIDALYWNAVNKEDRQIALDTTIVKKDLDLTSSQGSDVLPASYEELFLRADHDLDDEEKARYEELRGRLHDLIDKRDQQKRRLAGYRRLQEMLRPFENAKQSIQPNLVTKDGELARELERMSGLLGRVTGRVAEVRDGRRGVEREGVPAVSHEQRLADVMALT